MTRTIKFRTWWLLAAVVLGMLLALTPLPAGAAASDELDRFIASLEGGWVGDDNMTPFGKMGFAMLFERRGDGALHSRSSLNSETYIDLLFSRNAEGRWMLREEAAMEGLGTQAHSLAPVGKVDGLYRWVHEERPDYLTIDVGRDGDTMMLDVMLRGRDHVRFRLDRVPESELADLGREMRAAALKAPAEGTSIADVVEHPPAFLAATETAGDAAAAKSPIDEARRRLAESPDDAEAHLALARVLGDAINAEPANGPRFAFEMLTSLRRAIELDPGLTEAYHWLVGYYLNAPPIAGGSLAQAEATARQLSELDPEAGRALLEQVAARRSSSG